MSRTRHHLIKMRPPAPNWALATPGYWIRAMMTRPQRKLASVWQRNTERTPIADLDLQDKPPHGRKPHIYFW